MVHTDDGKKVPYSFLFWDAHLNIIPEINDLSKVWYVHGKHVLSFFERLLPGYLNTKEFTDFVNFWATPDFFDNDKWYIISFQDAPGKLLIDPKPIDLVRLFMLFRTATEEEVQKENFQAEGIYGPEVSLDAIGIKAPQRTGYTVLEWGGLKIDEVTPKHFL